MGNTAYDILSSFKEVLGGGLGFIGGFMAVAGIVMLVIQWRLNEGGGGAAVAGGVFMIIAGAIIALAAASVGSLDIEWAH